MKIRVVVLRNVQHDGRGLKDDMIVALMVDNDGNASVGIELEEPWLLRRDLQGRIEKSTNQCTFCAFLDRSILIVLIIENQYIIQRVLFANLTRR